LDGSALSEAILPHAQSLGRAAAAELVLLHVMVDTAPEFGAPEVPVLAPPAILREKQAELTAYLKSTCTKLEKTGSCVTYLLRHGGVSQTILEVARFMKADMIAMSTHGRTGMLRLLLGSVAEKVVHDSPIPVVLIRPQEG
jgi:nucleotide-binding universal stress UspA family protein